MYSSNDKLIDEIKKRLLSFRKNNPITIRHESGVRYIEVRRISTLVPRRGSESRKSSLLMKKNFLNEDKINLRLVPVIKSEKAIMKLNKDNNKIFQTEIIEDPYYKRNKLLLKRQKKNFNNSNFYLKTFSNILSNSNSIGKIKTFSKKSLFLSPFQINKNNKKIFQNLVDFSKEIHSPKHKEDILVKMKNNLNIKSFKKISDNKFQKRKKIFSAKFNLKQFKKKNNFLDIKNDKKNSEKKDQAQNHIKQILKEINNENDVIRNIIKNKKNKIKPNCYYNKLHLIKINNIIEKYSYNNID